MEKGLAIRIDLGNELTLLRNSLLCFCERFHSIGLPLAQANDDFGEASDRLVLFLQRLAVSTETLSSAFIRGKASLEDLAVLMRHLGFFNFSVSSAFVDEPGGRLVGDNERISKAKWGKAESLYVNLRD